MHIGLANEHCNGSGVGYGLLCVCGTACVASCVSDCDVACSYDCSSGIVGDCK